MPRLIRDITNTNQVKRWFLEERGNRSTRRKPLGAEKRTNKLNPHMTPDQGIEPAIPAPLDSRLQLWLDSGTH